jgi:transposase
MTQTAMPRDSVKTGAPIPLARISELRVKKPVRNQAEMLVRDLDSLVADDHPVRVIWDFLSKLDLMAFYTEIKVALDQAGRPASDPQVLLALWVYATTDGIGSARRLDALSHEHDVYRWLRGGVPVDYHLLSDFRVIHQKEMDDLITQIIAVLLKAKVIEIKRVSQDGIRVRASAGGSSFHREKTLAKCLKEAREQVERTVQEREHPNPELSGRKRAARERAAREKLERMEKAWKQLPEINETKERQKKHAGKAKAAKVKEARVSTTDPIARNMKMGDGGFRPGLNVQFATETASQVILATAVSNQGSDQGLAPEIEEQVEQRSGQRPVEYLYDGGFIDLNDIQAFEKKGIKVYAPLKKEEVKWRSGVAGSEEVMAWRERMKTEEGQTIYKERAASSECVNAIMRAKYGLQQFTVRGIPKALSVILLMVLAHNLMRWITLTT